MIRFQNQLTVLVATSRCRAELLRSHGALLQTRSRSPRARPRAAVATHRPPDRPRRWHHADSGVRYWYIMIVSILSTSYRLYNVINNNIEMNVALSLTIIDGRITALFWMRLDVACDHDES